MKLNLHGKLEMIGFLLPLLSIVSFQDSPSQSLKGGSTGNDEITATILHYCVFVGPLKVHEFLHVSVLRELIVEVLFPGLILSASKHLLFVASNYQAKFVARGIFTGHGWSETSFSAKKSVAYQPTTQALCVFLGTNSLDTFFFNLHIL